MPIIIRLSKTGPCRVADRNRLAFLVPRRSQRTEWLDEPGHSKETLAGNFKDIAFLNRWFGGWNLVDKCLRPFLPEVKPATLTMLDLASGAADVPLDLARRWHRCGINLEITAVDIDPVIVELARINLNTISD